MITLKLADRVISTEYPAFVMGILNCTPDSFYSESRGSFEKAMKLIDEGADIIDIGGESTRPCAEYVSAGEEIKRIIPVIEKIRQKSSVAVSVDTRKHEVMKAAFEAGADIINDISALEDDEKAGLFISEKKLPVILMHKRGTPDIMQKYTEYGNIFTEVNDYLEKRTAYAEKIGIAAEKIIVDPGIGFGKNSADCQKLVVNCGKLCSGKYKVLMALSRKSFIGQITGKDTEGRLTGTVVSNMAAVQNGASILRVHDVDACLDMLKILKAFSENS